MNTIKFKDSEKNALMWLFWKGMKITKSNKKYDIFDRLYQEISHTESERNKSTETSDKHETEQLNVLGVVRSFSEIKNRIKELKDEKQECLSDYPTASEKEQELIANKVVQIKLRINELEWIIS